MIHIERRERPARLKNPLARAHDAAAEFFASKAGHSGHIRFHFDPFLTDALKPLGELFHGKCAFCETSRDSRFETTAPMQVAHFRPPQNCVDQKGSHFPRHYGWLIAEWSNLYHACGHCLAAKRNRFPIAGDRVPFGAGPEELAAEGPLLLDPCQDNPEEHLVYTDDAKITSGTRRGRVSIELFDLNRQELVEQRQDRLAQLIAVLESKPKPGRKGGIEKDPLSRFIQDPSEYAGMCRQFARRFFDEIAAAKPATRERGLGRDDLDEDPLRGASKQGFSLPSDEPTLGVDPDEDRPDSDPDIDWALEIGHTAYSISDAATTRGATLSPSSETDDEHPFRARDFAETLKSTRYVSKAEQSATSREFEDYADALESFSLEVDDAEGSSSYHLQSRTIQWIELHNFRAIGDLTLEMPRREGSWTTLLGENGCGKSSVLQAVALALMGETYRSSLGLDARKFVRRGQSNGFAQVKLSGMRNALMLCFNKDSKHFTGEKDPKVLLLAYGATRLLPREPAKPHGTPYARVDNLFNPFVPLEDARRWLLDLAPEAFDRLQPSLKGLLNLGPDDDLTQNRAENRIDVTLFDTTVPIEQLSDGYQTVTALVAEIMSILLERWGDMATAEGIVLVDEIGAHLHPKWKMQITRGLRAAFPAVQFLVTTHDPLCLRGLEDDEVVVMRRNAKHEVVQVQDLPSVKALRVDQLLTSEHFGLSSVHDPESGRLFDEYYALLAKDRTEPEDQRLAELRGSLEEFSLMGQTRRERLMLTAIDQHLAKEAEAVGGPEASSRKQALDLKLERILSST